MSKQRKSFIIHFDSLNVLDDLNNEQAGMLFKAIKGHQLGEELTLDALIKVAFSPFKNQFARDAEKYEKLCEKNRLIAETRYATKSTTGKSGNHSLPKATKSTDNDSKNKSDSKSDSDNKKEVTRRFTPPTLEEVQQYCNERMNYVNPQDFIDHYTAANWFRGKTKIKCWKSCVRTWEKNAKPKSQTVKQFSDTTEQNINTIGEWLNE
jgi:hypothetical protein